MTVSRHRALLNLSVRTREPIASARRSADTGGSSAAILGSLPAAVQGALPVQLSFPPRQPRTANVICAPRTAGQVISLAEHRDPAEGVLSVGAAAA
ncbi:lantibiotic dehydratase [Actinomadura miaoliensis]|uniref:Lantibiotic dehydratase N-terminal domain-containing protein n=1 Tax=Actinomadura miaoliensis TaxID=430685 RepID=A0ABP7WYI2_9ACTN